MPPAGRNNIVARRYQIGGGVRGNVNGMHADAADARHRLHRQVLQRHPRRRRRRRRDRRRGQVARAAAAKSRDRAVTAEDFETLALRSSTGVARAKCLPSQQHDGAGAGRDRAARRREEPRSHQARSCRRRSCCRFVKNYLDERRLVGTVLEVIKPGYVEISLKVTLVRRTVGQIGSRQARDRGPPAPLPASARRRPRRQGLALRPRRLQDRPGPPRRGRARRRGHRQHHHLRRGQARRRRERAPRAARSSSTSSTSRSSSASGEEIV